MRAFLSERAAVTFAVGVYKHFGFKVGKHAFVVACREVGVVVDVLLLNDEHLVDVAEKRHVVFQIVAVFFGVFHAAPNGRCGKSVGLVFCVYVLEINLDVVRSHFAVGAGQIGQRVVVGVRSAKKRFALVVVGVSPVWSVEQVCHLVNGVDRGVDNGEERILGTDVGIGASDVVVVGASRKRNHSSQRQE